MKFSLLLVPILLLMACATQTIQQSPLELKATHGFVHVSTPVEFDADGINVTLRSLTTGLSFRLSPSEPNSQSLALWVPADSYEIEEMVGFDKGSYLPILVRPQQMTDLGGLTWVGVGDRERVLLPLRHPEIDAQLSSAKSRLAEHLSNEVIEWKPTAPPKEQPIPAGNTNLGLIADMIKSHIEEVNKAPLKNQLRETKDLESFTRIALSAAAPILGESSFDGRGSIFIGSNYGQLRKRSAEGKWRSLNTGTLSPVTAVESMGSRILVGTYNGEIRVSADGGETWKGAHKFEAFETVLSVHATGNSYIVLTQRYANPQDPISRLQVYSLDLAGEAQAKLLRRIDLPSNLHGYLRWSLRAVMGSRYYFVNAIESIERLDLKDLTWKKIALTHPVSHLQVNGDGSTVTAFIAQGAFSKLSVSADHGDTWLRLEIPPYVVNDIRMDSLVSGAASRWDPGAFSSSLELLKYEQSSKSWQKFWRAPPASCVRTIRDAQGLERYCVSVGGGIFRITAEGLALEFLAD